MLLKGNLHPKMFSYGYILPRNYISHIFEFQLVPFPFSFILGDPFMVFLSPLKYGGGNFFQKILFMGRQILWVTFIGGLFYMGGLIIRTYQWGGVSQNAFSSNLNTVYLKSFPNHDGIFT